MSWYAIDGVGDAFDATRRFLFPFDLRRWLRLGVIVFFVTAATGTGNGGQGVVSYSVDAGDLPPGLPTEVSQLTTAAILVTIAVLLAIALAFAVVSSVMQFVFFDALRTQEVRVREPFRRRFRQGLGLFAFVLVVVGAFVAIVGGGTVLGILTLGAAGALVFLLLSPILFGLGLALAVFLGFTSEFVVPVAIAEDVGILTGWRQFWPTLRENLAQFALYVVVRFLLGLLVGVVIGIVVTFVAVPLALVFGLLAAGVFFATANAVTPLSVALLVLLAIPFILILVLVSVVIQIPVSTYFGYYGLLVLGDADDRFDLIPELRGEVRPEV